MGPARLALTGLATLTLRHTALFGVVRLLVHLTAVIASLAIAPYTAFVHWIYRLRAIYKDNLDRRSHARSAGVQTITIRDDRDCLSQD